MYTNLVELLNKDTKKRRIIACNSKATANQFICLFNLVSAYRHYEQMFVEEGKEGPSFITDWVQNYQEHQGIMEFNEEILYKDNLKYLLTFGRENDSVKSLVFNGDSISIDNDESVDVFH